MTLKEYCKDNDMGEMLYQWDEERNQDFSPEKISSFSHRAVWWRCTRGHVWQAEVKDRVHHKSGCPYCAGKVPVRGETDLATLYPKVAAEWHPKKNKGVTPEDVTAGTDKIYWWQCSLGHEWRAAVENRTRKGNACPYCSGKRAWPGYNDLATEFPQLMKEWCYEYNTGVDPSKIRSHSGKRVFWKCQEGHVWDAYVFNRTSKKRPGCPVCAGNIKKGVGYARISPTEACLQAKQREKERDLAQRLKRRERKAKMEAPLQTVGGGI